ncbi:MAG: NTP transferase domain-containing protein [Candidatus Latescibacteria bacterium]|jgi:UDP-N-acetylglucosamine diphosphorylase / glucose-1-phosphate thymidylyltransferase / UDP-N-acetylgalactosamine diphosphorylase / glucosamine-1-phosphate N-acetyltransferase / galactosamine-1-phosphate N-acetyltransferase|nr:NTP transferase domain-containing protein [Candidatus Latescibacterota bacterium]
MKAVILAAGKGTRMKELTKTIPKPMVNINDKPMLEYVIRSIHNLGIKDFGIVVGYKQSIVQEYFKDGSLFDVSITYIEQKEQNGTGDALHLAKYFTSDEPFFFSFGDVLTSEENYTGMLEYYKKASCDFLLGLNRVDDPYRGAAVYLDDDNNIVRMIEKPPKGKSTTNLNNAGIMVLSNEIFDYTARLKPSPRGEYELTDVFGMLKDDERNLKGYPLSGYWKDIGTPEDLKSINELLA